MTFEDFGLSSIVTRAVAEAGYTTPTPIQSKAIPEALAGKDVLASADTGTGKTAAFMLPALDRLTRPTTGEGKGPRVLVLTPTRELATQVTTAAKKYGKYLNRLATVSILGGMPYEPQRRDLRRYVDILVATPGRLLDHHRAGMIDFRRLELLVLDEADRMLDMGFLEDVQVIMEALPPGRQTVFFSATLGPRVMSLAKDLTVDPVRIAIEPSSVTHDSITQSVLFADNDGHKKALLKAVLRRDGLQQAIIFTATKQGAQDLAEYLDEEGFASVPLHGDMHQRKRLKVLKQIRDARFQVLVATDVAARGIDVPSISHVVNYDLPRDAEVYTHRIGRTGRAGSQGWALTLVGGGDRRGLRFMEQRLGHEIARETIAGLEPQAREERRGRSSGNRGEPRGQRRERSYRDDSSRGGYPRGGYRQRDESRGRDFNRERPQRYASQGQSRDVFAFGERERGSDQASAAPRKERFSNWGNDRGKRSQGNGRKGGFGGEFQERGPRNDRGGAPRRHEAHGSSERGARPGHRGKGPKAHGGRHTGGARGGRSNQHRHRDGQRSASRSW